MTLRAGNITNMKISIDDKNASRYQFNDIKYLELSRYLSCGCHHENLERRFINLTMISFTFCKTSIIQRHLLRFVITFGGCICFLLIYLYGTNTHVLLLGHATFCLCTIDCCVLQRKFVLLQNRLFFIRSTHAYIFCSHLFISHLSLVSYLFKMQDGEKIFSTRLDKYRKRTISV